MKKLYITAAVAVLYLTGCATSTQNTKPLSFKSIDLLEKYGISESALVKTGDGNYMFVIPAPNGADIYKLDKNYKTLWKKTTPVLIDPVKYEIISDKLYILGYDQKKNRPVLLTYDLDGNVKKISYYGSEYDLARDFAIINGEIFIAITHYTPNNNSDIAVYSKNKHFEISTPGMDDVKFLEPFNGKILIVGTTQGKSEDVLIALKTMDGKTLWAKTIDLGMDEKPLKIKINNNQIELDVVSTDNMGAEKNVTFIIDKDGNVKSVKKGIEFEQLPIKYRT